MRQLYKKVQETQSEVQEIRRENQELQKNVKDIQNDVQKIVKALMATQLQASSPGVSPVSPFYSAYLPNGLFVCHT